MSNSNRITENQNLIHDLAADEQAMEDIMGMGLKIAEERAMAAA